MYRRIIQTIITTAIAIAVTGCGMLPGGANVSQLTTGVIASVGIDEAHRDTEVRFGNGYGLILPTNALPAEVGQVLSLVGNTVTIAPPPAPVPTSITLPIPEID